MDAAVVIWLNQGVSRSHWLRVTVAALARWLAHVQVGLMLLLAATGRRRSALKMLAAVGLVYAFSEALGLIWPRDRPFAARAGVQALVGHSPRRSFPSRHIASALAMAALGGAEHPRLGLLMAGVGWTLGASRVAAGLHYPSDVLGGAALGALIGRYIHKV